MSILLTTSHGYWEGTLAASISSTSRRRHDCYRKTECEPGTLPVSGLQRCPPAGLDGRTLEPPGHSLTGVQRVVEPCGDVLVRSLRSGGCAGAAGSGRLLSRGLHPCGHLDCLRCSLRRSCHDRQALG